MEGGPPRFRPGFTCPALLGKYNIEDMLFRVQGFHLLWRFFPKAFAITYLGNSTYALEYIDIYPHNPRMTKPPGMMHIRVWA